MCCPLILGDVTPIIGTSKFYRFKNRVSQYFRFEDFSLEKLEKTLSIIFQLNLASDEREVAHFNNSFQELNVTSDDLFEILNKVGHAK